MTSCGKGRLVMGLLAAWCALAAGCDDGPTDGDGDADADGGADGGGDADADGGECAAGCAIDGECVAPGAADPGNPCRRCDPAADREGWTAADGEPCDDGAYCTDGDTCRGAVCDGAPRACDDGVGCNGAESCDEAADACVDGESPCAAGTLCDPAADRCVADCAGCAVGALCVEAGAANPRNACQVCDPAASATAWTDADGAACDDGDFCNGADSCVSGACTDHAGDPCADAGDLCDGAGERCCATEAARGCDAAGDAIWLDGCGRPGALAEDCADEHGVCAAGECGCAAGFFGEGCARCAIRVDGVTGDDAATGASWAAALATVESALRAASLAGCEVWVGAGTYRPATGEGRAASFVLVEGVAVYGGFAGEETRREDRDPTAHETILSGDVGEAGDDADNAYHVVIGADGARLDGFTITGGRADGDGGDGLGGGLFSPSAAPVVAGCRFVGNHARSGGAIHASRAAIVVESTTFHANAAEWGGAVHLDATDARLAACTFTENVAVERGGALRVLEGTPRIVDCVFERNAAETGGAVAVSTAAPVFAGGTFRENVATRRGGAISSNGGAATVVFGATFAANEARDGGAAYNYESNATFVSCRLAENVASGDGGAMANVGSDPTVAGCLFDGNVAAGEGGAVYGETDSDPFLLNCTLRGNTAAAGGGLWSGAGSTPRLQSCVVWGNVSPDPAPARRNIVGTTASVTYSAIEGGAAGTGNIAADPLFRAGTSDLGPGSPCRDAGLMLLLPDDVADVDGDGVTAEPAPVDAAGAPRVVGPRIDMGALEAQDEATPPSIVAVRAVDDGRLAVVFDEPLDPETSLDPLAYALDGGALVTAAAAGWLGRTVILDAAPLVPCTEHTLTVTGPTDVAGNALPAGSTWTFRMPALLLADGFDDGDLEGWTAVDVGGIDGPSDWQIERGRLVQLSNVFGYFPPFGVYDRLGAHLRPASPAAAEWADYSLSVRLGSGDDDGVGVVFRVLDDDSYYAFDMDAERSFRSLRRHHDGAASHLALATGLGYVPGREYLVRVEVMGGEIRVIVDDEDVFGGPVIDPAPIATGGAGPYTWAGDGAWFDDVVVLGGCD